MDAGAAGGRVQAAPRPSQPQKGKWLITQLFLIKYKHIADTYPLQCTFL